MMRASLLLLTLSVSSSLQQCFTENDDTHFIGRSQINAWIASRHNFSVSLLKMMNTERRRQNIIFSPSNIHDALLLAYFGAEKETNTSLSKVLQIPPDQNKETTWRFYKNGQLKQVWEDINNYPLDNAVTLFMSNKLVLRPCIEEKVRRDVELIDYQSNLLAAEKYINGWIERRTHSRVKHYVHNLTRKTTATLVNAVYLKAKWAKPFNAEKTHYKEFHVNEYESRKISMMSKKDYFNEGYSMELKARLLILPYQGNHTAMIILLPDQDLNLMINRMNEDTLAYIADQRKYRLIKLLVYIPKMNYKNELNIHQAMETLGAGDSFTDFADFSGFTGRKEVSINFGDHHAVIEVDEEGAETAESAEVKGGLGMANAGYAETKPFVCDRPFAYVIYDFAGRKPIFMGVLRSPEQK